MVRLKDVSSVISVVNIVISIPYGAIKRGMLRWGDKVYPISIPYGAIKSLLILLIFLYIPYFNSLWCD